MSALIPPGCSTQHLDHLTGPLRVLHAGSPTDERLPLVLVHGGGSDNSAISWYRLFEPLSQGREVCAIDLPGFGGSIDATPVGGPESLADVLAESLERLGIKKAVTMGVSMGGDAALNLGLRHPHLVAALVLIAPGGLISVFRNTVTHRSAWLAAEAPDWLLLPATRVANRFVTTALRAMVEDPSTIPPEVIDEFAREARRPKAGIGYARYNQATLGPRRMLNDLTDQIDQITVPTLFFHGANDPLVNVAGSRRAAERMRCARCIVSPHCGHWAQLEAHDLFLAEVAPFLAEVDAHAP